MTPVSPPLLQPGGLRFAALPPLALYIHVPWCLRKCPYCDFNSHELKMELPEAGFLSGLTADLESVLPLVWGRRVYSVFIGGGTPSLLTPDAVDAILSAVRARLPLDHFAEITLEANPGTFEAGRYAGYRAAGVTRLSIGVQSLDDASLAAIGRVHDAAQARRAVATALAHFDTVNLDLMYALPGQTLLGARADIEAAVALGTTHLSAYHLTLEPNTLFHRHPPTLPDDDLAADMQAMVEDTLGAAGFQNYETSAFAKPGHRCRHNLNYWTFGDYIGVGPGAHGKISLPDRVLRQARVKHPREWLEKAPAGAAVAEAREVLPADLPLEFMMNALRLTDGFELRLFEERTGLPLSAVLPLLDRAEAEGYLTRDHVRAAPTLKGRRFLNDLLQIFLPSVSDAARRGRGNPAAGR